MSFIFCKTTQIEELEAIQVEHPLFKASILLQGAQIIEFSPKSNNFENLLWLSSSADYKSGKPVRGGIPVCWPWFGNLEKNPECIRQQIHSNYTPAHGLVRDIPWTLSSIEESCDTVIIELSISHNQTTQKIWPFEFSLTARFILSNMLTVELITENTGTKDFVISQALHTYLPTDDITKTYIHNTHRSFYIDALDQWTKKDQYGRVVFNQETDRLYFFKSNSKDKHFELRVETPARQLTIKSFNSTSAVIWNPWIYKSLRLSQFEPNDYKFMFCIESANVMEDVKRVAKQEHTSLKLTLGL